MHSPDWEGDFPQFFTTHDAEGTTVPRFFESDVLVELSSLPQQQRDTESGDQWLSETA